MNMKDEIKNISLVGVLLVVVLGLIVVSLLDFGKEKVSGEKLKSFDSYDELKTFLKNSNELNQGTYGIGGGRGALMEKAVGVPSAASTDDASSSGRAGSSETGQAADDYSTTNIQVKGVDEADVVKNDGRYIYNIAGNKVVIVDAYPANGMDIVSEIEFKDKNIREMFLNEDKLIVFAEGYEQIVTSGEGSEGNVRSSEKAAAGSGGVAVADMVIYPGYYGGESRLYAFIYDISDRGDPKLEDEISVDGNYANSRMIGDYVYIISSKYVNNEGPIMPMLKVNGVEERIAIGDLYYFDYYDYNYVFNIISAINVKNGDVNNKVYLTGSANNIYVSTDNIYLTYTKYLNEGDYWDKSIKDVIMPLLPESEREKINDVLDSDKGYNDKASEVNEIVADYSKSLKGDERSDFDEKLYNELDKFQREIRKESTRTIVHKIGIDEEKIEYKNEGEVRGNILNQFSMDEFDGNFRIATTSGEIWDGSSENNLYVLDENLDIAGKIEKLAPGEKIYSARFIGERAYLVTFKKTDPFYVVDLSNAENPKVLGYLKIPGYSDYLHPYDETHIIGVGKEAIDASEDESFGRDFAWYQGLKIAIFDVSDVNNPMESAKIVIGDRGTNSNALYDHKAFLFDKKKNLLVLPVNLAKINSAGYGGKIGPSSYGETVWQGAYVFDIKQDNIKIKGQITHFDDMKKYGPASEEPIGAERKDSGGNIWIKVKENSWKMKGSEMKETETIVKPDYYPAPNDYSWNDEIIDSQPGGIHYNPFYDYKYQVQRSLYIGDVLYTISPAKIKANDLNNIEEISKVEMPYPKENYGGSVIS